MKAKLNKKIIEHIKEQGTVYTSAALPPDISFGAPGECFDTCVLEACKSKYRYGYVEGIATDPTNSQWVLHAWLTDGRNAFDPTWSFYDNKIKKRVSEQLPCIYIGIEMPINKVVTFMETTTYQGVIANRHRAPEMAKLLTRGLN